MRTIDGLIVLAALAAAGPVAAQEKGSRATREFVEAAGHSDAFEMAEARTALAASTNPQVRAYAQRMLADHDGTSRALLEATDHAGVQPPPMGLGADQAPLLGALQSLKELDFDRAYATHQVLGHRFALTSEQGYAATGDDPAVRQAAASAVPIISAHLAEAERLRATLSGS